MHPHWIYMENLIAIIYMTKSISQNNMKYENFYVLFKREELQLSVNRGISQILVTTEQK